MGAGGARRWIDRVWRGMYLVAEVSFVTAGVLAMRAIGVTARSPVNRFGSRIREVVPLRVGRVIGPALPLVSLTWPLVPRADGPRLLPGAWAVVVSVAAVVYAVGLRRSSWIARYEPEHLATSERPLGYRPQRDADLRIHHLTRLHIVYATPLFVLATGADVGPGAERRAS